MSIRASRGARLLCAAALAWLGLALGAQAAHATYSKITIVKINQGGDQNDSFAFHPSLTPSAGDFSIKAGESNRKTLSVECNVGTSCIKQWGHLTQTISETPKSGYTLTSVTCRHTQGTSNWAGEPDTSSPIDTDTTVDLASAKITFGLNWWEWVKCYVTNTRDTGTIKVIKKVVAPAGDTGRFNLQVDGQNKATNVGDGGTTGDVTVTTGNHTVGETAGAATSLSDYTASTSCVDTAHPGGPADTDGTVSVAKDQRWVCTITNTRKTGTIKVTKALSPATDTGKFNLLVDNQTKAANVGDGGTTGTVVVLPGTHTVAEAAGTGTDLSNYTATLSCVNTAKGNAADNDGTLTVATGDAWECLFTNTRKSTPPPPHTDEPPTTPPTPVVPVTTQPKIKVSPARVKPGSAKLAGPSGCPRTSAVAATVTGRQIVKVTFYVDGKKVKTLTKANKKGGRWVLALNVKRLAFGAHRVQAKVQFAKSSQTKAKTLRFSFDRCHAAAARPKFTG